MSAAKIVTEPKIYGVFTSYILLNPKINKILILKNPNSKKHPLSISPKFTTFAASLHLINYFTHERKYQFY